MEGSGKKGQVMVRGCFFGLRTDKFKPAPPPGTDPEHWISPVTVHTDEDHMLIPIFSTPGKLKVYFKTLGIKEYTIGKIEDAEEFMGKMPAEADVVHDPKVGRNGETEFLLLRRSPEVH
jgi:hypothetical protein